MSFLTVIQIMKKRLPNQKTISSLVKLTSNLNRKMSIAIHI